MQTKILTDKPSIFFEPYTAKTKPRQSETDAMTKRLKSDGFKWGGQYGVVQVKKDAYYWSFIIVSQNLREGFITADGFSNTFDGALKDAQCFALERFPTGRFFMYGITDTRHRYRERHASRAKLKTGSDWRTRFPFWKDKAVIYRHEWQSGLDKVTACRIVKVTDAYVYAEPTQQLGVEPDSVPLTDCYRIDRESLERDGRARLRHAIMEVSVEGKPRPPFAEPSPDQKLAHLRKIMQRQHPDRGGNQEDFILTKEEYEAVKAKYMELKR